MHLSTRGAATTRAARGEGEEAGREQLAKQLEDHRAKLATIGNLDTETWPPRREDLERRVREKQRRRRANGEDAGGEGPVAAGHDKAEIDKELWNSFWETFRNSSAQILILVSDGKLGKEQRYEFPDGAPYCVRGMDLALDILREFKRPHLNKFDIILLAGLGTQPVGEKISELFDALPLLVPPSILCWDASSHRSLAEILTFNVEFLRATLEGRDPAIQNRLDLRGTIHTFAGMRRGHQGYSAVHFFPRNQIEEIMHIYYRLGLSAFELARRINRIVDFGMIIDFHKSGGNQTYLMNSTRFLFAELFGWMHVLRQQPAQLYFQPEIRGLEWAFSGQDLVPKDMDAAVGKVVSGPVQLYKFDQRAMGEAMVEQDGLEYKVLRYVDFLDTWEDIQKYFHKLEWGLNELSKIEHYIEVPPASPGQKPVYKLKGALRYRLMWIHTKLRRVVDSYTPELNQREPNIKKIASLDLEPSASSSSWLSVIGVLAAATASVGVLRAVSSRSPASS